MVSLLRMANPGPMVRAQPEPSRNTVVAVTIVASVTHTAQAILGGERGEIPLPS